MKLAFIGGARFGVGEPVAGGMESMLSSLAAAVGERGHPVTVFAGSGSAPQSLPNSVTCRPLVRTAFVPSEHARADVSMPPEQFMAEHDTYLALGVELRAGEFDVVHNHSLHYLPPLYDIDTPMVHTLHSPPTAWLESAHLRRTRPHDRVVSVSTANRGLWGSLVDDVVPNGVDTSTWGRFSAAKKSCWAVWSGRIVPEKAPHLAMDAARAAGRPLHLAGPVHDHDYFRTEVQPRLSETVVYLGHLRSDALASVLAHSAVAVVTPMWDEPYGLVVAEALASGTPVAAFARGGIPDQLDPSSGVVVPPGDVAALAVAINRAARLESSACRRRASSRCSLRATAARYIEIYEELAGLRMQPS